MDPMRDAEFIRNVKYYEYGDRIPPNKQSRYFDSPDLRQTPATPSGPGATLHRPQDRGRLSSGDHVFSYPCTSQRPALHATYYRSTKVRRFFVRTWSHFARRYLRTAATRAVRQPPLNPKSRTAHPTAGD
jgi:hypothetical protein